MRKFLIVVFILVIAVPVAIAGKHGVDALRNIQLKHLEQINADYSR